MVDLFKTWKKEKNGRFLTITALKVMAEDLYVLSCTLQGYEVKRTGKGSDFEERKVNLFTGRKGSKTLVEVKSNRTAPVSKVQKKTKKKSERHRVERPRDWF